MNAQSSPPGDRAGFTLVEVVIAIVILAVGVLGLAGATAFAVRQVTVSELNTKRTAAVQSVVEMLRSMDYDDLSTADGDSTIAPFSVRWTTDSLNQINTRVTVVTVGPGFTSQGGGMPVLDGEKQETFVYRITRP